jgi:phosphinothricin acetyltransferase
MEKLLEEGKHQGLDEILLFTGHHRKPAINLYKSLGFTVRESGLYNLKLS